MAGERKSERKQPHQRLFYSNIPGILSAHQGPGNLRGKFSERGSFKRSRVRRSRARAKNQTRFAASSEKMMEIYIRWVEVVDACTCGCNEGRWSAKFGDTWLEEE